MHKTENLDDGYLGSGKYLQRSIRYYGKENFKREILFQFDNEEEMIQKEIELVNEEFVARKDTYNLMLGGHGGKTDQDYIKLNQIRKERHLELLKNDLDYKKKVSKNISAGLVKRHKSNPNNNFINSKRFSGKKHSKETKEKLKKSKNKGLSNSQFGTCWITNDAENKKIIKGDLIPEGWKLGRKMKK